MADTAIKFPVPSIQLEGHKKIKEEVLKQINETTLVENLFGPNNNITRCDWGPGRFDPSRPWLQTLQFYLNQHLKKWCKVYDYDTFTIHEIWFQQYAKEGKHSWHVHGCNFTAVYFLDLPEGTPNTQWVDPETGQPSEFDVKEGDIIIFPSWTKHRAPTNESENMKTIISWNMDVDITEFFEVKND
jgi:mannose-6-phosphate isomerase-like protein (cupin superfamily)